MTFKSLDDILINVQRNKRWQRRGPFNQVVQVWPQVVGEMVAQHTRPVRLERHVLQVATSSAVWAQNLRFERYLILQKLQTMGVEALRDIQFSTAQWSATLSSSSDVETAWQQKVWVNHPSRLTCRPSPSATPLAGEDAVSAFEHWSARRRQQASALPKCPNCQCSTPVGELERWPYCAFCMAQSWSR